MWEVWFQSGFLIPNQISPGGAECYKVDSSLGELGCGAMQSYSVGKSRPRRAWDFLGLPISLT